MAQRGSAGAAEGVVDYAAPQITGREEPFHSEIRETLKGRTQALEDLAVELLARGLSVRDIEDAFRDESGRSLLSQTAVSEIGERLWADYQEFASRDLSEYGIVYLFVDGIAERIRPGQKREPMLAAAHRLRNLVAKTPEDLWPEFKARVSAAYQAPSRAIARELAAGVVADYQTELPTATACFMDDFEACIAHPECPSPIAVPSVPPTCWSACLSRNAGSDLERRQMRAVREELDHEYQAHNGLNPTASADAAPIQLSSTSRT
ncbi:MAG: transposase [Deltaproteobacteria bacterium]|nr:transposase [Deltaproteobacteria bacterium]